MALWRRSRDRFSERLAEGCEQGREGKRATSFHGFQAQDSDLTAFDAPIWAGFSSDKEWSTLVLSCLSTQ